MSLRSFSESKLTEPMSQKALSKSELFDSMSLKHLSDSDLILSTQSTLRDLRQAEVHLLRHFAEIAERRLWAEAGSLYKFLGQTFELTDDQIYPRLQAMRLLQALPELEVKLESGQLSVTNALKAQKVFAAESKTRPLSKEEKREVIAHIENTSTREADRILATRYPQTKSLPEKIKPIAANQNLIQFYVDDETLKHIEDLKARFSHQMPSGKMEDLIKILIKKVISPAKQRTKPARSRTKVAQPEQGQATSTNAPTQTQAMRHASNNWPAPKPAPIQTQTPKPVANFPIKTRSRYISAVAKRELEKTRHQGCAYKDRSTGQRSGSTYFLQMDHIHQFSNGGSNAAENLQWLCGFHNRHRFATGREMGTGGETEGEAEELTGGRAAVT
jgi:hypothetical protein